MTPILVTQDRRVFYKQMEEEQGETGNETMEDSEEDNKFNSLI